MIVPSKNQKTYGVLHTENYFSFLGFCKKVNSEEIQKVDIYLDNTLIDTVLADKYIQSIDDIYDIKSFGFTYNLEEKYIGSKSTISFKNHLTQENLQNSPYTLIEKTHSNFNEVRFIYIVSQMNNPEKINIQSKVNQYKKDAISFLATNENIEDSNFMSYIKEVSERFKTYQINAFYFNNTQKDKILTILNDLSNIHFIKLNDPNQLINNTEFYIFNHNFPKIQRNIFLILGYYFNNISIIQYVDNLSIFTLKNYNTSTHPCIKDPELYGYKKDDLLKYNQNLFDLIYKDLLKNELNIELDLNQTVHDFLFKELILYISKSDKIKHIYNTLHKKVWKYTDYK